jgi:hypothetical protein
LREQGKDAHPVATRYEGERDDAAEPTADPSPEPRASEP